LAQDDYRPKKTTKKKRQNIQRGECIVYLAEKPSSTAGPVGKREV